MTTIKINLAATTCQEKTGLSKKCVRFFQDETNIPAAEPLQPPQSAEDDPAGGSENGRKARLGPAKAGICSVV